MSFESYLADLWFHNIQKLDNVNHLNHGKIYAEDGSVRDFQINDYIVAASVEGAPGDFYKVEIKFNKLSTRDKGKLNKLIKDNSQVKNKILNDTLPEELFECDVDILPESLNDFKMSCSCKIRDCSVNTR